MLNETIDTAPTFTIPTADYPVTITEVERGQWGKFEGDSYRWVLSFGNVANIDGDIIEDKTRWYFTPTRVSSGNKLGKLAAACGLSIDGLTTQAFIGRRLIASVVVEPDENGVLENKITAVRAATSKAAKPAANGATAAAQPVNGGDPWE